MTQLEKSLVGKTVQFHAQRIIKGNPVKGLVVLEDKEWITLKLSHDLEGMVTFWYKYEEKAFRKTLISELTIL